MKKGIKFVILFLCLESRFLIHFLHDITLNLISNFILFLVYMCIFAFKSALACLPDELRERLIETQENRDKFQELYESVNLLSATDALKLFHDDILTKKAVEQSGSTEASVSVGAAQEHISNSSSLGTYSTKLQSLLLESPEIKVQFFHQEASTPDRC